MGHGTWFSHFGGTAWQNLMNLMMVLGWPGTFESPEGVDAAACAADPHCHAEQMWVGPLSPLFGGRYHAVEVEAARLTALIHVSIVVVVLLIVAYLVYTKVQNAKEALVPEARLTARTFAEIVVGGTYGMMKDIMGEKAARFFLPLIGTCAFFILFSNGLGLIPGFSSPTSSLNVTLACGLIIFVCTHVFGVKEHGIAYFKHFFGPIIKWYALPLMLLMLVVELISHFVRPFSLGIRLMANMFADHAVVLVFVMMIAWVVPVPVMLLGTLVVIVQTAVFCLLSTVYIAMAVEHSEEGH
jgi:F-type H+-transporting ATPase subunit a